MKKIISVLLFFLLIAFIGGGYLFYRTVEAKYPWLWMYIADQLRPNPTHEIEGTKHILFSFVDHFEPHDPETMQRWLDSYPGMVRGHQDADGKLPQHTWFWYFSESGPEEKSLFLKQLSGLAYENLGEIEIHMHHFNDDEESFMKLMNDAIRLSQERGALITAEQAPRTAFGFIHGLWSLDNSRGAGACGVNNELIALRRLGCYADFTHPSWGTMHPRMINRLYYATDDPDEPKSYDTGVEMETGKAPVGDLLIFEGPSVVRWQNLKPVYDHNDVTMVDLPTKERVDDWIRAGVHVKGRPEWIFVKVHTHGAVPRDHEAVLGKYRDAMHEYLETAYNDGENYQLHYVTAREAYNIAKAAEAGKRGDPNQYRDFVIKPYVNRYLIADVPFETISFAEKSAVINFLAPPGKEIKLRIRAHKVEVQGNVTVHETKESDEETVIRFTQLKQGPVGINFQLIEPQDSENKAVENRESVIDPVMPDVVASGSGK